MSVQTDNNIVDRVHDYEKGSEVKTQKSKRKIYGGKVSWNLQRVISTHSLSLPQMRSLWVV